MFWHFPGYPVVETLLSNIEFVGSIPGQGAKIPHALRQNTYKGSSTVATSIKISKKWFTERKIIKKKKEN